MFCTANTFFRPLGSTVRGCDTSAVCLAGSPTFLPPSPLSKHQSDEALVRQDLCFRRFGFFPDPTITQASKTTRTTSSVFQPRAKISHHASSSGVPTTRFAPVRLLL